MSAFVGHTKMKSWAFICTCGFNIKTEFYTNSDDSMFMVRVVHESIDYVELLYYGRTTPVDVVGEMVLREIRNIIRASKKCGIPLEIKQAAW